MRCGCDFWDSGGVRSCFTPIREDPRLSSLQTDIRGDFVSVLVLAEIHHEVGQGGNYGMWEQLPDLWQSTNSSRLPLKDTPEFSTETAMFL